MKGFAALLVLATGVTSHYTFSDLVHQNKMVGRPWQYVREHTRGYMPTKGNDILSNDFRCQPGAASGAKTDVYTVKGGDQVALLGAYGMRKIEHPGPAHVYMSRAPNDDVKSYAGDGDWFKVREAILCSNPDNKGILTTSWCTWGQPGINFTIPTHVPDGEYLARVEHIPLHNAQGRPGGAEFYYSCAQLKVTGNGANGLAPSHTAKIPGMIKPDDPAVLFNIWNPAGVKNYPVVPGSQLIVGGTRWGNTDGSSAGVTTQTN